MRFELSFWEQKQYFTNIDVVIVGSGIVGLSAALSLKEKSPKINILIVESGALPSGASTKNAGFACIGSISELIDDLKKREEEEVFALVEKRYNGLKRLRERVGDAGMHYNAYGGYEVFDNVINYEECADKITDFNFELNKRIGIKEIYKNADASIAKLGLNNTKHLISCSAEGQIDSGMMMEALIDKAKLAGIKILNGLHVTSFENENDKIKLQTKNGYIFQAGRMLICTNGFAKQLLPSEDVEPARGQVLITSQIPLLKIKGNFHFDRGYFYFRNVEDRVLIGGGRNLSFETEHTTEQNVTTLIQSKLEELLREMILPGINYSIEQRWAGTMGIGTNKDPIVKKIQKNIYCAVRMGGMGIALGSLTGEEAAALVFAEL